MLHALTMEYHMFFRRYRLYTILLGCTLTVGALGCAPKRVGPTAPSGYFFSLVASYSMFFGTSTEVVVRVQDAQGNPVDGIPVEFQLEAAWQDKASLSPLRVFTTNQGRASTILRPGTIGVVRVIVRVENTTQEVAITDTQRGDPPGDS